HIAFPAHWVRGIITLAEAGPHEGVTWANSSYERTDLAGRLTIGHPSPTADTRIILDGNGQRSRSFIVDGVVGLVDVSRPQVQSLPPQFRGGERDRFLGIFMSATYVALIANPFWVLELPSRINALDAFVLPSSEGCVTEFESKLRLPPRVTQDPAPAAAAQ
ncbi:MAG TPA: hypothetical protein VM842_07020, partial [Nitrospira sp.]|nr:hypothetical protein [Nitrospira sp.]